MKIAVIGAGSVGKALAPSLSRAGNEVVLSARTPEHAAAAAATGVQAARSNAAAVQDADLVVLAIPYAAGSDVAAEVAHLVAGKAILDVTNPMKDDASGLVTESTSSAAEELQQLFPKGVVIKAFHTLFASRQAAPSLELEVPVAADDASSKERVMDLVKSMGFTFLDVGPLSAARYLEGMAFLNILMNIQHGWGWTSAWKLER